MMWRSGVLIGITMVVFAGTISVKPAGADNSDTGSGFNFSSRFPFPPPQEIPPPVGHRDPATFNSSIFSLSFDAVSLIANSAQSSVDNRLATFKTTAASSAHRTSDRLNNASGKATMTMPADSFAAFGAGGWTQVFGLTTPTTHVDPLVEQGNFSGAMLGFDTKLSDHSIGGIFFGGSSGKLSNDDNNNRVSANGFYGGFYVTRLWGRSIIDLSVSAGLTDQDSQRLVSDVNKNAVGSYTGYFFNPTLTVSHFTTVAGQLIVPSLKLGYSGYIFEDFTEKGPVENLTVSAHTANMMHAQAQLTVPIEEVFFDDTSFKFEGRGGLRTQLNLKGDTITTAHQGHQLSIDIAEHAYKLDVFLGADAVYTLSSGIMLFGEFETAVDTTGDIEAQAFFGTRFSF